VFSTLRAGVVDTSHVIKLSGWVSKIYFSNRVCGRTTVSFNLGSRFSKGLSTLNRGDLSMVSPSIHSYESTKACTGILLECPNDIREPLKRGIECTAKPFKYSTVKIISFECCPAYLNNSA